MPTRCPRATEPPKPQRLSSGRAAAAVAFALTNALTLPAQEDPDESPQFEPAPEIATRIENGEWFAPSRWRRGTNGQLEVWNIADTGGEIAGRDHFKPLLRDGFENDFYNHGFIGAIALLCHGPGDLLGMTDAELHFSALGVDTSDMGLRQFLARELARIEELDATKTQGRARALDLALAISVLERRQVRGAAAECMAYANSESAPEVVRKRARHAIERLLGRPSTLARRRLSPATLRLPLNFDAAIIIDHSRLPDLSWLTPAGRRVAALSTARMLRQSGGLISRPQRNGAQILTDIVSELPFGFALRFGNMRFDHSCVLAQAKVGGDMPIALCWQAAGVLEPRLQPLATAKANQRVRRPKALNGDVEFREDGLLATAGMGAGRPRPTRGAELLRDHDAAIRVVIPKTSKAWPLLRFVELPAILGGELRFTFDERGMRCLGEVLARDPEDATELADKAQGLLAMVAPEACLPWQLREDDRAIELAKRLLAAKITTNESTVQLESRLPALTAAERTRFVELFARR